MSLSKPHLPLPRTLAVLAMTATLCVSPSRSRAQDVDPLAAALTLENAFVKVIADSESSVVSIARYKSKAADHTQGRFEFRPNDPNRDEQNPSNPDFVPNDFGAGVLFAPSWNANERFILTNYHVVRGGPVVGSATEKEDFKLYVRYANRRGHEARIVAADPRSDLAVLQVDAATMGIDKSELRPMVLSQQPEIRKGQFALALGNPYAVARDGSPSASWGMIANISRRPAPAGSSPDDESRQTIHHFGTLLQVDNRLSIGSSGGAVLNLKGELIGLATSLAAIDGYEKAVGYAIPINAAMRRVIDDLAHGYEVEYGFLGVQLKDFDGEDLRRQYPEVRSPVATVALGVLADSPAALGGMQPRDIILSVNGVPVQNRSDLMRLVGLLGPEVTATVRVYRERSTRPQREHQLSIRLGKWPVMDEDGIITSATRREKWRGITIDYSTGRQRHMVWAQSRYYRAVVVTKVESGDAGAKPELAPGDLIARVNGAPVTTPNEFEKVVRGMDGDVQLELSDGRKIVVHK
jgi:serine protease Do